MNCPFLSFQAQVVSGIKGTVFRFMHGDCRFTPSSTEKFVSSLLCVGYSMEAAAGDGPSDDPQAIAKTSYHEKMGKSFPNQMAVEEETNPMCPLPAPGAFPSAYTEISPTAGF
jgi:hypothetical protein